MKPEAYFVTDEGALFAVINGSPYQIEQSADAPLAPGRYDVDMKPLLEEENMRTVSDRLRIHYRAKAKLGLLKRDAQGKYTFMQQCVSNIVDSGEASDEDEAESICEMLWEEFEDLGEWE